MVLVPDAIYQYVVALETGSIASVLLLFRLPWARWLRHRFQIHPDNQ